MRRALAWALAAGIAASVVAPSAALAATPSPTPSLGPGESAIVYSVVITRVSTDSDGKKHRDPDEKTTLTLVCSAESCRFLVGEKGFYLSQASWVPGAAPAATHVDGNTSSCQSDKGPAGDLTLTVDAASFTGVFSTPAPGWENCNGTQTYRWAQVLTYTGTYVSGETCILDVGGCPTPTPTPVATLVAEGPADPEPAAASASYLATGSAAAPSVLSTLATPATAGTAPSQLALAALLAVVLVLLTALPTALLNSAAEAGSDRFSTWWAGRRARRTAPIAVDDAPDLAGDAAGHDGDVPVPRSAAVWSHTWWWAAAGVAAASIISAFVDPQFGFNAGSARVVLSILISFAIDVVAGWLLVVWLVHRLVPGATHSYAFQPLSLLIVVAAVVFTRVTGFEPGIVFGLVAGVAFGAIVGARLEARAALVTLGYGFALAVVAWVAYGAVAATSGDSFWATFAVETLSSIAIGGMAALPIALFPLRGLPGRAVWAWNRWVWAGAYVVGLFAFFVVLMPMPFSWEQVQWNLGAWIGVYLAYAVAAVVAWLVLARPWHREPPADAGAGPEEVPAGRLEE